MPGDIKVDKKVRQPNFNIQRLPLFLFALSFLFFLGGVLLTLKTVYRKKGLSSIISRAQQSEALAKKINMLKQEEKKINQELNLLNGHLKKDVRWSAKLSQLRNLIPLEVWLTELSFKKQATKDSAGEILYLKGGLVPQENISSIGTLTKFINQLKGDKTFFADFDNLILVDSQSEIHKNIEIMNFIIEVSLKKGKTS